MECLLEQTINITPEEVDIGVIGRYLQELPEKALHLGIRVVLAAVFLFVGIQVIRLIRRIVIKSLEKAGADKGVAQFLDSLIIIGLTILLVLMIAVSFGLAAASVVAMLGSAGVAFALAVQGGLSNCAGGVLILLVKPFVVGDYIVEGTKGLEGTDMEIQLLYTKLRPVDGTVITLPNGSLANNNITNYSTVHSRRMDVSVGIAYDADIRRAKEVLLSVLAKDEAVLQDMDRSVFVKELDECAVTLNVRCWFDNGDYWDGRARILEKCKLALDENGIAIPYPQMDVHIMGEEKN